MAEMTRKVDLAAQNAVQKKKRFVERIRGARKDSEQMVGYPRFVMGEFESEILRVSVTL